MDRLHCLHQIICQAANDRRDVKDSAHARPSPARTRKTNVMWKAPAEEVVGHFPFHTVMSQKKIDSWRVDELETWIFSGLAGEQK